MATTATTVTQQTLIYDLPARREQNMGPGRDQHWGLEMKIGWANVLSRLTLDPV